MSVKFYCDGCGAELGPQEDRVKRKLGDIEVEIMSSFKGCWNGGHFCAPCIIKTVNEGKPSVGMNIASPSSSRHELSQNDLQAIALADFVAAEKGPVSLRALKAAQKILREDG